MVQFNKLVNPTQNKNADHQTVQACPGYARGIFLFIKMPIKKMGVFMNTNYDLLEVNLQLNRIQLNSLLEVTTEQLNSLEHFVNEFGDYGLKEDRRQNYKTLKQIQNLIVNKLKYIEHCEKIDTLVY